MSESIIELVLYALDVVDDVLVKHGPLLYFPRVELIQLFTQEVHLVYRLVHRGLRLSHHILVS
jgi:hypothetical protein